MCPPSAATVTPGGWRFGGSLVRSRFSTVTVGTVLLAVLTSIWAFPTGPAGAANGPMGPTGGSMADLTGWVDPFIGTNGANTFPGATMPFGMTQPSPDTQPGDYGYGGSSINGFSTVQLSGVGVPALGDVSLMPVTGTVTSTDPNQYASGFSHTQETATPGYYAVDLQRYGVHAELTATDRTAWERYTFPTRSSGTILVNLAHAQQPTTSAQVTVVDPHTVEGYQTTAAGNRPATVYFTAHFDQPIAASGTWNGAGISWGTPSTTGPDVGAAVQFPPSQHPVVTSIGVSYVSLADAQMNLAAAGPSQSFNAVRNQAHAAWNNMLHRVQVTGGSDDQRTTFYTALYHSLVEPNLFSDVNGNYVGMDGHIHQAVGRSEYTNLSIWDIYRTEGELLGIVAPAQARDIALSMVSDTKELGWVPLWVEANTEIYAMSGDPAIPMFADALATGEITPAELQTIYPILEADATEAPPPGNPEVGRVGYQDRPFYRQHGWAPYNPNVYQQSAAASVTLEWALDDCGLSHVAASLGHPADAATLASSAHSYRNEFDPSTGFFRPRLADGSWMTPFDPTQWTAPWFGGQGYDEGSAWEYLWQVPQDAPDFAGLLGGTSAALSKADQFFKFDQVQANPAAVTSLWADSWPHPGNHYDPWNEEDLQAPYTYSALGVSWKTALLVRAQLSLYNSTPSGLPPDDLGAMSSWYVLSALGLYPYAAGSGVYALTTPLFDQAVVHAPNGAAAHPIIIDAPGASTDTYVHALTLNGDVHNAAWISYGQLAGAHLTYTLSSNPDPNWASGPNGAIPAYCPN